MSLAWLTSPGRHLISLSPLIGWEAGRPARTVMELRKSNFQPKTFSKNASDKYNDLEEDLEKSLIHLRN